MTGSDEGGTATGGLRGITEDTPEHAGTPGEPGSIDGVSAFGAAPESYDVSGSAADPGTTAEAGRTAGHSGGLVEGAGEEADDDLITGDRGGVTGPSDL